MDEVVTIDTPVEIITTAPAPDLSPVADVVVEPVVVSTKKTKAVAVELRGEVLEGHDSLRIINN